MKTPNIDKLREEVLKLQHFPDEMFEDPEQVHFTRCLIVEHDLLRTEAAKIMHDLVSLAEQAMHEANNDGADYDTDAELKEANEFIRSVLPGSVTPRDHCAGGSGVGGSGS